MLIEELGCQYFRSESLNFNTQLTPAINFCNSRYSRYPNNKSRKPRGKTNMKDSPEIIATNDDLAYFIFIALSLFFSSSSFAFFPGLSHSLRSGSLPTF
jgi:hypothetical protein